MNDYRLHIDLLDAAFVASAVGVQAKGLAYRLGHDSGRDVMRQEDYGLSSLSGYVIRTGSPDGSQPINRSEEDWNGCGDYWLGRNVLTDLVVNVPGEGLLVINDAIINITRQKQIVSTALVGRSGTIKEYITDGDYQINLSVGIVAVDAGGTIIDQYPERAVAQLREILDRPEALEVNSAFLDLFMIRKIVVTGFTVRQMTHSNRQVIEITALSDDDYVIQSIDY
ncbi:MAG: hypothetical protein K2G05_02040 [Duncaniella sp.]|nr:hypothetical protein [Duncaniella sp.]MDE6066790.1 hypothetical protein [Duncaniella sp.]